PGGGDLGPSCAAGQIACDGVCVIAQSCALSVTSASPVGGFLDGGDWVTLGGNGFVPGMKVYIADGRAPVRVVAGNSATLPGGFTYRSAGLETTWEQKPLMKVRGEDPAIAVMQDGRVLVAGGTTVPDSIADALSTADIYNQTTNT